MDCFLDVPWAGNCLSGGFGKLVGDVEFSVIISEACYSNSKVEVHLIPNLVPAYPGYIAAQGQFMLGDMESHHLAVITDAFELTLCTKRVIHSYINMNS